MEHLSDCIELKMKIDLCNDIENEIRSSDENHQQIFDYIISTKPIEVKTTLNDPYFIWMLEQNHIDFDELTDEAKNIVAPLIIAKVQKRLELQQKIKEIQETIERKIRIFRNNRND